MDNPNRDEMSEMISMIPTGPIDHDLRRFNIHEVCALAKTVPRRVRYLVSSKLIPPPIGRKKGATYTWQHIQLIRDINLATWQRGLNVREAAEFCLYGVQKSNGRTALSSVARPKSGKMTEVVFRITDDIRISAPMDATPVEQGVFDLIVSAALRIVESKRAVLSKVARDRHNLLKKTSSSKRRRSDGS